MKGQGKLSTPKVEHDTFQLIRNNFFCVRKNEVSSPCPIYVIVTARLSVKYNGIAVNSNTAMRKSLLRLTYLKALNSVVTII